MSGRDCLLLQLEPVLQVFHDLIASAFSVSSIISIDDASLYILSEEFIFYIQKSYIIGCSEIWVTCPIFVLWWRLPGENACRFSPFAGDMQLIYGVVVKKSDAGRERV